MNVQCKEPPGKRPAPTAARRATAPPAATAALPLGLAILKSPELERVRPFQFLALYVTRTPCNDCATRIDRIRRLYEAGGGSLDVVVRSLAPYQGSRDAARNEETGRGTRAGGTYSLRRLRQMDIRVEVWDLHRDARRLFGPAVDMTQAGAVAGRLNAKVQQLQAVINSLPLVDVM
jgi:hypothetical protein